jgi:dihydrofolate reductase
MMRKVTYGGAVSLDGFLAAADGAIDWLRHSNDVQKVMAEYWKNVDTVLMGRKTYEVSLSMNAPKGKDAAKAKQDLSKLTYRTYVFSRTLKTIDDPNVELVTQDAADFVRDLKRRPGRDICLMGGGELAQSLLEADLVDEIGLNIHPILLGSGIPTFRDPGHRVKLSLVESRAIEGGCILAKYDIAR